MIRWTTAGAVAAPETLQIRVAPRFSERVSVGAPVPRRPLTLDEVDANVRHYTVGQQGPRTRPVRRLVLSGVESHDQHDELGGRLPTWRALGIQEVVVHAGATGTAGVLAGAMGQGADRVVVTVARIDEEVLQALALLPLPALELSVSLTEAVRPYLASLVERLRSRPPRSVAWVWPYPAEGEPPPPTSSDVVAAVVAAGGLTLPRARFVHVPACQEPGADGDGLRWRTRNRFYVDADHQLGAALLFFPDLVQLAKPDRCRFCRADLRCDGVAAPWLHEGRTGVLEPL